jgi:hypothetical protein
VKAASASTLMELDRAEEYVSRLGSASASSNWADPQSWIRRRFWKRSVDISESIRVGGTMVSA